MASPSRGQQRAHRLSKSFKMRPIVSVDFIVQDKPDTSLAVQGASHVVESRAQVIEPSRTRTSTPTSTYPLGLVKPMVRLYDIPNTSSMMEMLHFWRVLFGHVNGAMPKLSTTL